MKTSDQRAHATVIAGIVVGSFAGALLRGAAALVSPIRGESPLIRSLVISTTGGALLGALLGVALKRWALSASQPLLGIALIAAIGSFGAAAAVDLVAKDAAPWPFWRDAVLNIGVTILAARAAVVWIRRRSPG